LFGNLIFIDPSLSCMTFFLTFLKSSWTSYVHGHLFKKIKFTWFKLYLLCHRIQQAKNCKKEIKYNASAKLVKVQNMLYLRAFPPHISIQNTMKWVICAHFRLCWHAFAVTVTPTKCLLDLTGTTFMVIVSCRIINITWIVK